MDFKNLTTEDLVKLNQIHKKRTSLMIEIEKLETEYNEITNKMKCLGCIIDGRIEEPKTRHLRIGKKKFNADPVEGLDYLFAENIIKKSPSNVAKFLSDYTLNKKSVGDYLGNISNSFNVEVLHEYISMYDFGGIDFVDALRLFLSGFQLPGESQKIDKIISLWAKSYNDQNSGFFKNETETYVMTFAVIMLNTSLHNPTAKKSNGGFGREEDFIKIMKDFDANTHFDLKFVKKVFRNIKSQPLICNHIMKKDNEIFVNTLISSEKSGWLWKLGGRVKNWKKRWFVLCDSNLFYLVHPDSPSLKGVIPLESLMIRQTNDKPNKYSFEIYSSNNEIVKACKSDKGGRTEQGHHKNYKIYCESKVELQQWMDAIQKSITTIWQLKLLSNIE